MQSPQISQRFLKYSSQKLPCVGADDATARVTVMRQKDRHCPPATGLPHDTLQICVLGMRASSAG